MRDDFPKAVQRIVASRVGNQCSNPECRALTSGPQSDPTKSSNVGVAAHITAASPGGPRYDQRLSSQERKHADNAIWLCQNCAKLIDNDPPKFPTGLLQGWKSRAEADALARIGKTAVIKKRARAGAAGSAGEVRRNLALKKRIQRDFLSHTRVNPATGVRRPFDKFSYSAVIVHSIENDTYPESTDSLQVSTWFKVELWDLYFGGIEVIVSAKAGVMDEQGNWAMLPYGQEFDEDRYHRVTILAIGRIPWRNIVEYDLGGDEYYNLPHVFCEFSNDGMPYEAIVHRLADGDHYWPLEPDRQFALPSTC
jgi:hypothetical protein